MANNENLINFTERTPSELRELSIKGQKASTEAKRARKTLRQELEILMSMVDDNGKTWQENISTSLIKQALKGNTKAYEIIRDTMGQKPIEQIQQIEPPKIVDDI